MAAQAANLTSVTSHGLVRWTALITRPDAGRSWQLSGSDRAGVALSWAYRLSRKAIYGMSIAERKGEVA